MKNRITSTVTLFVGSLSLLAPVSQGQTSSTNLLTNGSFERWGQVEESTLNNRKGQSFQWPQLVSRLAPVGTQFIAEREGTPPGVIAVRDDSDAKEGNYSVRIENSDPDKIGTLVVDRFSVKPSTRYRVSLWYKIKDVVSNSKSGVLFWVAQGPKDDFWKQRSAQTFPATIRTGDTDWMREIFEFETTPTTGLADISLQLRNASGTVWFDALSVTEVGPVSNIPEF